MSANEPKQAIRLCKTIETLAGREFNPLRTKDVAEALDVAPPVATRTLQHLAIAGWVEKTPDGRWRLTHNATRFGTAISQGIQREEARTREEVHNMTRRPF